MSFKDLFEDIGNLFSWLWGLVKGLYTSEVFFYSVLAFALIAFIAWFVNAWKNYDENDYE